MEQWGVASEPEGLGVGQWGVASEPEGVEAGRHGVASWPVGQGLGQWGVVSGLWAWEMGGAQQLMAPEVSGGSCTQSQ